MKDEKRPKDDLIKELKSLRRAVTQLENKQQDRSAADSFLSGILDSLDDPVFVKDDHHRWVTLNDAACRLLGRTREEVIGKTDRELLPERDAAAIAEQDDEVLNTGMSVFHTDRFGPKGDERILATKKSLFTDPATGHKFIAGVIRDITEWREAENRVRESEERYRNIVETAPDGIITMNRAGFIVSCNEAAAAITGVPPSEVEGTHFTRLPTLRMQDLPRYTKIFAAVLHGKVPPPLEVTWQHTDGSERVGEVHISLMRKKKRIAGMQIIFRDITDRKKADEERHELEENLYQSEKMQAIGQLAGGIAHDFNNQLGIIVGYAEILEEALHADEESRQFLERILNAARRASGLTRQLLAFARKGHYQNVTVDVHKIIEEVMGLLEHTMDKRIAMTSVLAADPPLVSGDPTQLQNAILNVALNARDAMPDGGQLKFSTANVVLDRSYCEKQPYKVLPGRYLQIGVEDTGTGMTEEVRKRIFEPFYTTKEKSKGTGMGMAAVYGTVKGHKGSIEIVSAPQEGTLVMLFFPVAVDAEKKDEKPVPEPASGRVARVLVVDDEDMIRTMTAELLRKLGHSPLLAKDGLEAAEIYKKQHNEIDLVLLDMIMPHLNGHETLLKLQQTDPDVKAVLCSGYNMDTTTRAAIRDGALMFLQKPLSRSILAQAIAEVMLDEG